MFFLLPLALLGAVLLFVGGPDLYSLRSFRSLWEVGHLFCFALWVYLYARWRAEASFPRILLEVIVLTFLVGGVTELIQGMIGRNASWQDLGNDYVGSLVGVLFFAPARKKLFRPWLLLLQLPLLAFVCWTLFPVAGIAIDEALLWARFPQLSGFESRLEAGRWIGSTRRSVSHDVHFAGDASLKVELTTQIYSGFRLRGAPPDWRGYHSVAFQIFNPDPQPLTLYFRIVDRAFNFKHVDSYNDSFELEPGWNGIEVALADVEKGPRGRLLDLSQVFEMLFYVKKLDSPRIIYLDEVRLQP
ncbi:MAG: hypothetical protein C0622_05685 [Desulfuromonas sp.]|nr:MAG: hypothetical protein C0622_05685 [Desulfuromonas sp.]